MVVGYIAIALFVVCFGWNVHHQDVQNIKTKETQNIVLKKEVNQLQQKQNKTLKTFHGDKIANLGKDNVK